MRGCSDHGMGCSLLHYHHPITVMVMIMRLVYADPRTCHARVRVRVYSHLARRDTHTRSCRCKVCTEYYIHTLKQVLVTSETSNPTFSWLHLVQKHGQQQHASHQEQDSEDTEVKTLTVIDVQSCTVHQRSLDGDRLKVQTIRKAAAARYNCKIRRTVLLDIP